MSRSKARILVGKRLAIVGEKFEIGSWLVE